MRPIDRLSARPPFTRQASDISVAESGRATPDPLLGANALGLQDDALEMAPRRQSVGGQFKLTGTKHQAAQSAKRVLPYWREGLAFVIAVAFTSWLSVLTGRMRALEDVPFCDEV